MRDRVNRGPGSGPPVPAGEPEPLIDLAVPEAPAGREQRLRPAPRPRGPEPGQQLSLFGVEAAAPAPDDLAGLLAGPGQVVRMGGTARVSIVVDEAWRAPVLVGELALRGLPATCVPTADEHTGVRTAYSATLAELAGAWLRGAVKVPPRGFGLDGRRLRLWALAVGYLDALGFTLRLGGSDESSWEPVGAALAALGVPAVLLGPRAGGPAYRITGRRRLLRLAELIGDAPAGVPPGVWPTRDAAARAAPAAPVREPGPGAAALRRDRNRPGQSGVT
jgi:hypothetical protein